MRASLACALTFVLGCGSDSGPAIQGNTADGAAGSSAGAGGSAGSAGMKAGGAGGNAGSVAGAGGSAAGAGGSAGGSMAGAGGSAGGSIAGAGGSAGGAGATDGGMPDGAADAGPDGSAGAGSDAADAMVPPPSRFSSSTALVRFGKAGLVPCSATPAAAAAQTFTISNTGSDPFSWQGTLGKSPSPFTIAPSSGILGAKGSGADTMTITVTPAALPFPADTTANAYGDTITFITTLSGELAHTVDLEQSAEGAVIEVDPATPIDFGNVPVGSTASNKIKVTNSGSAAAKVTLTETTTGSPNASYTLDGMHADTLTLAKGASATVNAVFAPGSMAGDAIASESSVAITVDPATILCAPVPDKPQLKGTGTTALVKTEPASMVIFTGGATTQAGTMLPVPGAGFTYCGTTAAPQVITFSNPGTNDYTITAVTLGQGAGSPYTVAIGPNSGLVKAGGTNTVTITSAAVPATFDFKKPALDFSDTLTVTTDAQNDMPHVFNLVQSPYGAVLQSFFPLPMSGVTTLTFNNVAAGGEGLIPLAVTNNGNADATILVSDIMGNAPAGTFSFDNAVVAAFDASQPPFDAHFNPPVGTAGMQFSGTAKFGVKDTPLCAPLPLASFVMGGTPTSAAPIKIAPAALHFNDIACGANLPGGAPTGTVTITNTTGSAITWSASIPPNANGTTFALSKATDMVAAHAMGSFTVSPAPVPPAADVSTNGDVYSTTLTITIGSDMYSLPVTESALGAMLAFEHASIDSNHPKGVASSTSTPFKLQNFGNQAIEVVLTLDVASGLGDPKLNLNNVPPPTTLTVTGTVPKIGAGGIVVGLGANIINTGLPSNTGTASVGVTLSDTPGGVLCTPLPAAMIVNAK